jgi:hypothetical protein
MLSTEFYAGTLKFRYVLYYCWAEVSKRLGFVVPEELFSTAVLDVTWTYRF